MTPGRRARWTAVGVVVGAAVLYGLLPRLDGVRDAIDQARTGSGWWMALATGLEVCSFAGYALLFAAVFGGDRIDRAASWLITLAGVAATRLLNAGGAGGIALTAWALRRAGRDARTATADITAFLLLLYAVYMTGLVVAGGGLLLGVLPGDAPVALAVPALLLGTAALVVVPLLGLVPRHAPRDGRGPRAQRIAEILDGIPGGVRRALRIVRTRDRRLLGALAWWAFDIGALWAALHAFGGGLPVAELVLAYLVGTLGNLLPLPGGVGGVEGGIIGGLNACGVDLGTAVVAVLAYRLVSLWLPAAAGVLALPALRRRMRDWPGPP